MSEPESPDARHLLDDPGAEGPEKPGAEPGASSVMLAALRGARADVPDAAHVEALSRSIAAAIGGGGGGGGSAGGSGSGAAGAAKGAALGAGAKGAIGALAVSVAIGVGVIAARGGGADGKADANASANANANANASATASASASAAASEGTRASANAGAGEAVVDVHALPAAAGDARRAPSAGGSPEEEMTLLRSAQDALAGSPAEALARCEAHARAYPAGALAEEREVIAVDALLRLGRRAEAEKRAARFRAAHPGSAYLRRLDSLLGD